MRFRPTQAAAAAVLSLFVALALAGCGGGPSGPQSMPPMPVTVVQLKTGTVDLQRELPGLVSARQVAEVRPQVSGVVKRILFQEGGKVVAGQQLYLLDDALYRAAARSAEA